MKIKTSADGYVPSSHDSISIFILKAENIQNKLPATCNGSRLILSTGYPHKKVSTTGKNSIHGITARLLQASRN